MRETVIRIIKYGMLPFGMIYTLFHRQSSLTILMYHRVNDSVCKELSVTKDNFLWQMEYLRRKGFQIVSLDRAAELVENGEIGRQGREVGQAPKYVALTFDDGYEDFYTDAFPVLSRYGYPSAIYPVTGFIETGQVFWWDRDLGESRLMNWNQIQELISTGLVAVGSHTLTHPDFNKIEIKEIEQELLRSRELLQERLSSEVSHFSYPRGIVTPFSKEAARKIYRTAVSIFDGREDDLMQWKRLPAQRSDGRLLFAARLRGWLIPEEWIKRKLIRY